MPTLRRLFDIAARRSPSGNGDTLLQRMQAAANNTSIFASALVDDLAGDVAEILQDITDALALIDGSPPPADAETGAQELLTAVQSDHEATDVLAGILGSAQQPDTLATITEAQIASNNALNDFGTWLDNLNEGTSDPNIVAVEDAIGAAVTVLLATLTDVAELRFISGGLGFKCQQLAEVIGSNCTTIQEKIEGIILDPTTVQGSSLGGAVAADAYWPARPDAVSDALNGATVDAFDSIQSVDGLGLGPGQAGQVSALRTSVGTSIGGGGYAGNAATDPLGALLEYAAANLPQ